MLETIPIPLDQSSVSCDGGSGSQGHPKIYLDLSEQGHAVCPYCSQTFVTASSS